MPLRVTQPFDDHAIGDEIVDPETVSKVLASEHAGYVVAVSEPVEVPAQPEENA